MPDPGRDRAWEIQSASEAQTIAIGRAVGEALAPGSAVLLIGELGSGKTTFVRGVARGLGVRRGVRSPTFVLVNEYRGRLTLHHCDFYRLAGESDVFDLGLQECLDLGHAVVVEWADRARRALPSDALIVTIRYGPGERGRSLTLQAEGSESACLLKRARARLADDVSALR